MPTASEALPSVKEIELFADDLDVARAAELFQKHGCLVVRGLMTPYVKTIARDIEATYQQSVALLDQATKSDVGWHTPNGALFLPAPAHFTRDKQI
ncbi:MAG: mitomycin antibiotic biosynthesis protein, partial [Armatimonadota bacterium]|nr:mitomycin antibiotic biosynthesis protein [Armatimonadota bacterium]